MFFDDSRAGEWATPQTNLHNGNRRQAISGLGAEGLALRSVVSQVAFVARTVGSAEL